MTVCIAAVCALPDGRPVIIAAADRKITIGEIEYEPDQTKMVDLASRTIGLFAGDMTLHAGIMPRVQDRVAKALEDEPTNINVSTIADFYAEEFAYYRRTKAEREILFPLGLNFDRYLVRQSSMAHYQVEKIDSRLTSYFIDSTALIAGIDPSGAHIYSVGDPGVSSCMDTPHFACAGSGAWLATSQFMLARYNRTWPFTRTLWMVFQAKARAEKAIGVGKMTDLVLISAGGPSPIYRLQPEQLSALYKIYDATEAAEKAAHEAAQDQLEQYLKSLAAAERGSGDQRQTEAPPQPPQQSSEPPPTSEGA